MKKLFCILLCCAGGILLHSCGSNTTVEKTEDKATTTESNFPLSPAQLVDLWNTAHARKDTSAFSKLYGDSVLFYQTQLLRSDVIRKKAKLFKKNPDFTQEISGLKTDTEKVNQLTCSFIKKVTVKGEAKSYPSYLVLKDPGNGWQIISESDEITDKNIAAKKEKNNNEKTAKVEGDYNGDGKKEFAWLEAPKTTEDNFGECVGNCECYIRFSDESIAPIKADMCIGGQPVNHGDLNEDGADELGLLPEWWTSCWQAYFVYTFRNNEWKLAVPSITTHCVQWEDGVEVISKDPKRKGYAIIHYTEMNPEADFKVKSKSVKVDK